MRGDDKWTWNYNHPITLNHNAPDQFTLFEQLPFVAHTADKVFVCMLEPQYNTLNARKILFRAALIVHLLQNPAESSGDRYNGKTGNAERFSCHKQVRVCIFTLGSTRPIHLSDNIGEIAKVHHGLLCKCIREYVEHENKRHHEDAGKFYQHYYELEGESGPTEQLAHLTTPIPSYVSTAFSNAEDVLEDDGGLDIKRVVHEQLDKKLNYIMRKKFLVEDFVRANKRKTDNWNNMECKDMNLTKKTKCAGAGGSDLSSGDDAGIPKQKCLQWCKAQERTVLPVVAASPEEIAVGLLAVNC